MIRKLSLHRWFGLTGVTGASLLFLSWQVNFRGVYSYNIGFYPFDDADEWRYTACSRLVEHGYHLFSEVFSAQPPVLFVSLAGGMRIMGDSIMGARWVEIAFGLLAVLSCAWIAWMLGGGIASTITALVLVFSPGFLVYAHAIEAEGPMAALGTLSLALLLLPNKKWVQMAVGCAGLFLALAILAKLFAAVLFLPAIWLLWNRERSVRERLISVFVYGVSTVIPVVLEFLLVSPREQWTQVVQLHERASSLIFDTGPSALHQLGSFALLDPGLCVLAGVGLVLVFLYTDRNTAIWLSLWVFSQILMLLVFKPLFPHHLAILYPSMAVVVGAGASAGWQLWGTGKWLSAAPLVLAGAVYMILFPRLIHEDRHVLYATSAQPRDVAVDFVSTHSGSTDFVSTDDLQLADRTHRLVPPPLCDPSNVRLRAGYLTETDLIRATKTYRARLVVAQGNFLQVPGYLSWVGRNYKSAGSANGYHFFVERR